MRKHIAAYLLLSGLVSAGYTFTSQAVPLDTCIRQALENNPDAEAASKRIEAARAMISQAASAWYPQINLSGTYARTDNPPQAFFMQLNQRQASMQKDFNNPDDTDNVRLSAGAQWLLCDGGNRNRSWRMARLGTEAADYGYQAVINELIHTVTKGYYSVLQAEAFVKVQQEAVNSLEESLRVANERFSAGSSVKIDVLNLEVQLSSAREDLIKAENGVQLAIAALNTAIGETLVGDEGLPVPDIATLPQPPDENVGTAENRPEFKAAEKMVTIKETAYRKTIGNYSPNLSAFGSVDWDSDSFNDFENSYFAGVALSWNAFTGFRRGGQSREAAAELAQAKAQVASAENNLRLDLNKALLDAQEAYKRLDVTRKSLESAEEALRITQEQYKQGAADITILLTAQLGRTATRTRNVAATYDYLTALSNVERAKGKLVEDWLND